MSANKTSSSAIIPPPEILTLIVESFGELYGGFDYARKHLKKFRLVCKAFEQAINPFLFNQIFISSNLEALEVARSVTEKFGGFVHTLVYDHIVHRKLNRSAYEIEVRDLLKRLPGGAFINEKTDDFEDDMSKDPTAFQAHLTLWYEAYNRRALIQDDLCRTGQMMAHLCSALKSIPNLKRVVIGNPSIECPMASRVYDSMVADNLRRLGVREEDYCRIPDCEYSLRQHLDYQPLHQDNVYPPPIDSFYPLIMALYATRSSVCEIDMEASHGEAWNNSSILPISAFAMVESRIRYFVCVFPLLTKLHVDFHIHEQEWDDSTLQEYLTHAQVASALSLAKNLECLYIGLAVEEEMEWRYIGEERHTTFDAILGGCRFPKLRSLTLQEFDSDEESLKQFLQASPQLEYLFLASFLLVSGNWAHLADSIRHCLALKEAKLNRLLSKDLGRRFYYRKEFEEYFLLSCENPFTEEAYNDPSRQPSRHSIMESGRILRAHYRWIHQGLKS